MKTLLTARFAILLTCSTLFSAHSSAQSPAVPIQDFFKSYFEENLKDEPENATGIGRLPWSEQNVGLKEPIDAFHACWHIGSF